MKTIGFIGLLLLVLGLCVTCATANMKQCQETCGLNGVVEYINDPSKCTCNEMMLRYKDSFNGSEWEHGSPRH